jgi:hypothetical protein
MYPHHVLPECDDFAGTYPEYLQIMGMNRLRRKNFLYTIPSSAACCKGQEKIAHLFFR